MFFSFKQRVEDFIVEEVLWFELDGKWDFLYIFFEKKEKNTMDVLAVLMKRFKLKRHQLGISWLKDKKWITRQRISIGKNVLAQIGGQNTFIKILKTQVKIIEQKYHSDLLKVWQHSGNYFEIRLRSQMPINPLLKKQFEEKLTMIDEQWFGNYFGMQRFGKWLKNWKRAVKIFDGWAFDEKDHLLRFQLQARVSMHFNRMLQQRVEQWYRYLDGDILMKGNNAWRAEAAILWTNTSWETTITPFDYKLSKKNNEEKDFFFPEWIDNKPIFTSSLNKEVERTKDMIRKERIPSWALLGYNIVLPKHGSSAFDFERSYMQNIKFLIDWVKICKHVGIYGIRRPLRVFPQNLAYTRDNDDLIVKFGLPTGAYATVFLASLFQGVDPSGYDEYFKIPL